MGRASGLQSATGNFRAALITSSRMVPLSGLRLGPLPRLRADGTGKPPAVRAIFKVARSDRGGPASLLGHARGCPVDRAIGPKTSIQAPTHRVGSRPERPDLFSRFRIEDRKARKQGAADEATKEDQTTAPAEAAGSVAEPQDPQATRKEQVGSRALALGL